jgi:hypothetical protein
MSEIIITSNEQLIELVHKEIQIHGNNCDLNHIDVSNVWNMSYIFFKTQFDGDISKWNVSKACDMSCMFAYSKFNGDISKWNISKVENMNNMFESCEAPKPWWYIVDNDLRKNAIENFNLNQKLQKTLNVNCIKIKKLRKIINYSSHQENFLPQSQYFLRLQ